LIAQEREIGPQSNPKRRADFRRIDGDYGEMTVIDGQFFLQFYIVAQLHLALTSPVAAIKGKNEGELANQFRKPDYLAVLIRELDIGEPLSYGLIHILVSPPSGIAGIFY
jgi:hypothetical protein